MPPRLTLLPARYAPTTLAWVYLGVCSARHLANLWQNRHDRLMKYALRRLTGPVIAAAFAVAALCVAEARAQGTDDKGQADSAFSVQNSKLQSKSTIVGDAAKRVAAEQAISAEMRYRIDAFGHQLVGT